ncbi:hypothetical protein PAF17_19375 [Paracoccus sp. Z330]|uniref:Uncharacterized protein n=1 Tax=Paracoccus onchidii TaxID=3017813 RepID=A0ABT4ZJY0_9RHOB|nr:hypothetical protein [Paracoccus onchidii]MDB6179628.1 hypothetical protein [Paracoccus onchidii]
MTHEELLSDATIDRAAKDHALFNRLRDGEATRHRCKTEFIRLVMQRAKELKQAAKTANHAEAADKAMAAAESEGRAVVFIHDPNDSNHLIRELGKLVAAKRSAFMYGDAPIIIREGESAIARTKLRDSDGRVILDEGGAPLTAPYRTPRAWSLKAATAHNLSLEVAAFFTETEKAIKPAKLPSDVAARMPDLWTEQLPPLAGFASYPLWSGGKMLLG